MIKENNSELKQKLGTELSSYNAINNGVNFDLIGEEILTHAKAELDRVNEMIQANPIKDINDDEKETDIYLEMTKVGRELKEKINELKVKFTFLGPQAKAIAHSIRNATYSAEQLFWGIKIEQNILDKFDKKAFGIDDTQEIETSIIELVMLHSILTGEQFKGLTFETYLIAKAVLDITEYVKAYNFLNYQADKIQLAIKNWEDAKFERSVN